MGYHQHSQARGGWSLFGITFILVVVFFTLRHDLKSLVEGNENTGSNEDFEEQSNASQGGVPAYPSNATESKTYYAGIASQIYSEISQSLDDVDKFPAFERCADFLEQVRNGADMAAIANQFGVKTFDEPFYTDKTDWVANLFEALQRYKNRIIDGYPLVPLSGMSQEDLQPTVDRINSKLMLINRKIV